MGKGLGSQFIGAWVRQMGREAAHTSYGNITGKNTITEFRDVTDTKTFPGFSNYVKLLFASIIPFVGIVAIIKGLNRLFSKKIIYTVTVEESVYKLDRRYSDGKRYEGTQSIQKRVLKDKSECPPKDVKSYHIHAIVYIIVGLLNIGYGLSVADGVKADNEKDRLITENSLSWTSMQYTDKFTEAVSTYDIIYPTVDSVLTKKVAIIRESGKYTLLIQSEYEFKSEYLSKSGKFVRPIEFNSAKGIKTANMPDDLNEKVLATPFSESEKWKSYEIPAGIISDKGVIKLRSKGEFSSDKFYVFNFGD